MSDEGPDLFQREDLVDSQLLHTEYQEVNQEFRHRNQLLQNTFYLMIIAAGIFLGLFIRFGSTENPALLGGLIISLGVVATIIGNLFLKHYHARSSAAVVRMHAEWVANGSRESSKRALTLGWGVAGGGARYDDEKDCIVRRGSHVHYLVKCPEAIFSAESFGLTLIYAGAILLAIGVGLASSVVTSGLIPWLVGGITIALIATFYGVARGQVKDPSEYPIY